MLLIALKVSTILAIAHLVTRLLRSNSAALRHLVWTLALIAILALPLLSPWLPTISLAHPPSFKFFVATHSTTAPALPNGNPSTLPTWRTLALIAWAAGAILGFARVFIGYLSILRMKRDADLIQSHPVRILQTPPGTMPMTCGIWKPAILLPRSSDWTFERKRLIILHEMAHIRRHDVAAHLLGRIALYVYWWNPLAWSAWRQFVQERERAADDLVLTSGESNLTYATHLVEIARSLQCTPELGAVAMASNSNLYARLEAILRTKCNRQSPSRVVLVTAVACTILCLIPVAALQGQSSSPLIQKGTTELAAENYSAAISDFNQAAQQGGTSQADMWLAVSHQDQGNIKEAARLYQAALDFTPKAEESVVILDLYAQMLTQNGQADEAEKLSARAAEIRSQIDSSSKSMPGDPNAYHVGKTIKSPKLISKVEPEYSSEAKAAKYQGVVLLQVEIGTDGFAHNIHIRRPLGLGLDQKAIAAISQWKFLPGAKDGKPVAVIATIEVHFQLT